MMMFTPTEPDEGAQPADNLSAIIIAVVIVVATLAFSFRFISFLHAKETAIVLGLLVLVTVDPLRVRIPRRGLRFFAPLWCILIWGFVAHLVFGQAEVPAFTVVEMLRLGAVFLVASFAFECQGSAFWRQRFLDVIAFSSVLIGGLALLQYFGLVEFLLPKFEGYDQPMYSVFGNQDLLGGFLAVGVCLLVHNFMRNPRVERFMLAGLLLLVPALVLCGSRSAWLASVVGVVVVMFSGRNEIRRAMVLAISGLAIVLLMCAFNPEGTVGRVGGTFGEDDVGGRARLWFWDATIRMVGDAPIAGVGLGNYRYQSPFYHGAALHAEGGESHYSNSLHTLHAHSDPLELLAETGVIGLGLALWMLWKLRKFRGAEWGAVVALLVFSLFNGTYSSAPHLLCGLILLGSLAARNDWARNDSAGVDYPLRARLPEAGWLSCSLVAVTWALALAIVWTTLLPSYAFRSAELAYENEVSGTAEIVRAAALARWPDYEAMESWAIVLSEGKDYEEAGDWFDRAHSGLDTGRVWFFDGIAAEGLGDVERAKACYREALWRWPRERAVWRRLAPLLGLEERAALRSEAERWFDADEVAQMF